MICLVYKIYDHHYNNYSIVDVLPLAVVDFSYNSFSLLFCINVYSKFRIAHHTAPYWSHCKCRQI